MFRNLSQQERSAVYSIVAVNIPAEHAVEINDGSSAVEARLWCADLLSKLSHELCFVDENYIDLLPMITYDSSFTQVKEDIRKEICAQYISQLSISDHASAVKLYTKLLIYLVESGKFDGRGRVLMRNLLNVLDMHCHEGIWVEMQLNSFMVGVQETLDRAKGGKVDKYRYAKVGLVALGAGAVIAVTGGLVSITFQIIFSISRY
jgi:hypothetical protein